MSNETKSRALGMNFSTAGGRLRKMILFDLLQRFDLDWCFRCEEPIEDIGDLSIEHKEPWQTADDPKAVYFDLDNISFSHLSCNCRASNGGPRRKGQCGQGHLMVGDNVCVQTNGRRMCRICRQRVQARYRSKNRSMLTRKERERRTKMVG